MVSVCCSTITLYHQSGPRRCFGRSRPDEPLHRISGGIQFPVATSGDTRCCDKNNGWVPFRGGQGIPPFQSSNAAKNGGASTRPDARGVHCYAACRLGEELLTQVETIMQALTIRGADGVCGTEFLDVHIPRYAARILELRDAGNTIVTVPCREHNWHTTHQIRYVLIPKGQLFA